MRPTISLLKLQGQSRRKLRLDRQKERAFFALSFCLYPLNQQCVYSYRAKHLVRDTLIPVMETQATGDDTFCNYVMNIEYLFLDETMQPRIGYRSVVDAVVS